MLLMQSVYGFQNTNGPDFIFLQLNSYAASLRELYRWGVKMTYASVLYGMVTSTATVASQMMVLVIGEFLPISSEQSSV